MKTISLGDYAYLKGIINAAKTKIKKKLATDTDNCNNDGFWKQIDKEKKDICPECGNLGYYIKEYSISGDNYRHYDPIPCGCKYTSNYLKEKELTDSNWIKMNDEQILIDYKTLVQADRMLFLVGQHGNAVLDDELREQMIKCASDIRKVYMNMKGKE